MNELLPLLGYAVALTALYVAYVPRRRRLPRLARPALCGLALFAAAVSSLTIAKVGGAGAVHFVSLSASFLLAAASVGWLLVGALSVMRARRQSPPADVDFSFLIASADTAPTAVSEPVKGRRSKLDHRRWINRLKKIRFMQHRFSFLTDPP